jgi:hypothetical protein
MAHFCQLDENNVVTQVIVVGNKDCSDANGVEKESIGIAFCERLFGGTWKQTSYNGTIRKNYAGIGYTYNADIDAFVPPKPYASWILNTDTAQWDAPLAMPDDGKMYSWDEATTSWQEVVEPVVEPESSAVIVIENATAIIDLDDGTASLSIDGGV